MISPLLGLIKRSGHHDVLISVAGSEMSPPRLLRNSALAGRLTTEAV